MATLIVEPLDAVTWFTSVERLNAAQGREALKISNRLRLAFYLSNLAPPPLAPLVATGLSEVAFERLLRAAAFESAALALIGNSLSYEITCDRAARRFSARVSDGTVSGTSPGRTDDAASALLLGWIDYLLALRESCAEAPQRASHRPA